MQVNYLSNPVRGLTADDGSQEYDEYPPAAFPENAGRAHVRPINKTDNQRAGGKIGSQSRLYYNVGEIVELAVSRL